MAWSISRWRLFGTTAVHAISIRRPMTMAVARQGYTANHESIRRTKASTLIVGTSSASAVSPVARTATAALTRSTTPEGRVGLLDGSETARVGERSLDQVALRHGVPERLGHMRNLEKRFARQGIP